MRVASAPRRLLAGRSTAQRLADSRLLLSHARTMSTSYTPAKPKVGTLEAMDGNTAAVVSASFFLLRNALRARAWSCHALLIIGP